MFGRYFNTEKYEIPSNYKLKSFKSNKGLFMDIKTVSIIGTGNRGAEAYGKLLLNQPDKYKIVALCDINKIKLQKYSKLFHVEKNNCFSNQEDFFKEKRSDLTIIATMDKDHVKAGKKALELGYDLLIEKPISNNLEECLKLLQYQKKYGGKVLVCHVLRYAPAFLKVKEILDSGAIGKIIMIDSIEQVSYWHQAHSYIRGNWRSKEETASMILAKSCHDLDLIQYYANSKADTVSSIGDLRFFKRENQPDDAADRCTECKYKKSCPYSAELFYIDEWKSKYYSKDAWPFNVITDESPLTEKALKTAIENNDYGRCVFACDNDVVDNQIVTIKFENGINAVFKMTAFTDDCGRIMRFFGTNGDLLLDETREIIEVKKFGKEKIIYDKLLTEKDNMGHGGGDSRMIDTLYDILTGKILADTTLEKSLESHLIAFAAEESRLKDGEVMYLNKIR